MWGLLADADRLRVFSALAFQPCTTAAVAEVTGLTLRRVVAALAKLEAGGAVRVLDEVWSVDLAEIRRRARDEAARDDGYEEDGLAPREAAVLRAFLRDCRLVSIPAVRSKRLVVLDHICKVFEIGVRYPEAEVDVLVRAFHDDYAALRRYLVDEGFLTRDAGVYWRTGGTVTL